MLFAGVKEGERRKKDSDSKEPSICEICFVYFYVVSLLSIFVYRYAANGSAARGNFFCTFLN